ncbi:MAG: hypothetical protein KIT62_05795 [Cyclobacteriaceae bacterium]|nr:hypothetical protein [Cyclobacteriaceae bacterium]
MATTITKVRRIGNSRGILFPKTILEESGIKNSVQIVVKNKTIVSSAAEEKKKKSWSYFKRNRKVKPDFVINTFDATDWAWE